MGDTDILSTMKTKNRFERSIQIVAWLKTEFKLDNLKNVILFDVIFDEDGSQLCGCV